ncbi:MAG: hypothetical protein QM760_00820 [Nibricoccus sp.]
MPLPVMVEEMSGKQTTSPARSAPPSPGYVLLVRRSVGRGSVMQNDLHRRALGKTRAEAVLEAEVLEKELNGGLTFAEAEAAQIQTARELRDPKVTAGLKEGAYLVAVQTLHGASKMQGFTIWSKRKAPLKKATPARRSK